MSASKEKRARHSRQKSGFTAPQAGKKEDTTRKYRRNAWLTVALVVVMAVLVLVVNSNLFYTVLPAASIGGTDYSAAEVTYYYKSAYYEFTNTYGNYVSYFFDPNKPLKDQAYSETQTWHDYFEETALENMRNITMLCDEAAKTGFTLDQSYLDEIDLGMENLRSQITLTGYYETLNQYFASNYGKGVTEELVRRMSERTYLSNAYYDHLVESFDYSPEALAAYYQENADKYDTFNFYTSFIEAEAGEEENADAEAAQAEALKTAQLLAAAGSVEEFLALSEEHTGESANLSHTAGSSLGAAYADWMKDSARKAGDAAALEDEAGGVYAVYFLGREDNRYKTVNVRHILVATEKNEDKEYTQEARDAALSKAEDILAEWKAGEATEDSFGQLAIKYSEDTGSVENGGLYSDVYKYAMVPEFNDFCFDPARKPGDVGIVYCTSSSYEGYHVIYFVDHGALYSEQLARRDMTQADYEVWKNERLPAYTVTEAFSFRFANR